MQSAMVGPACRCPWAGSDPLYVQYHDEEWGVPKSTDLEFFEKIVLEGFQSGLSWITILRKREAFREAFDRFDPEKIAGYDAGKVEALVQDARIIRHRGKIEAAVVNARAYLEMKPKQSLRDFFWEATGGAPIQNSFASMSEVPPQTPLSQALANGLKQRGFKFCGPTTLYALMQSCGLVNDHLVSCHRHAACAALKP